MRGGLTPLTSPALDEISRHLIAALFAEGGTVGFAESLTGGQLVAALTAVPGASRVVRGAVIAYAPDVKASLLAVDAEVLGSQGPVCTEVAEQMARGARVALGASYGVSATGEAGPESASGQPVGTVHVAVDGPRGTASLALEIPGPRADVQREAVAAALRLLADSLCGPSSGTAVRTHEP